MRLGLNSMIDAAKEAARLFAKPKQKTQAHYFQQEAEDTWRSLGDEKCKDQYWPIFKDAAESSMLGDLRTIRETAERGIDAQGKPIRIKGAYFLKGARKLGLGKRRAAKKTTTKTRILPKHAAAQ